MAGHVLLCIARQPAWVGSAGSKEAHLPSGPSHCSAQQPPSVIQPQTTGSPLGPGSCSMAHWPGSCCRGSPTGTAWHAIKSRRTISSKYSALQVCRTWIRVRPSHLKPVGVKSCRSITRLDIAPRLLADACALRRGTLPWGAAARLREAGALTGVDLFEGMPGDRSSITVNQTIRCGGPRFQLFEGSSSRRDWGIPGNLIKTLNGTLD